MTVGIVQKEIRIGMSQADVAAALGSPNIVTRDSEGKETWIYENCYKVRDSKYVRGKSILSLFGKLFKTGWDDEFDSKDTYSNYKIQQKQHIGVILVSCKQILRGVEMNKLWISLFLSIFVFGCATTNGTLQKTQLQIREFQTRSYETNDVKMVMKAMLNILQDDGFIVKNAVLDRAFCLQRNQLILRIKEKHFLQLFSSGLTQCGKKHQLLSALQM